VFFAAALGFAALLAATLLAWPSQPSPLALPPAGRLAAEGELPTPSPDAPGTLADQFCAEPDDPSYGIIDPCPPPLGADHEVELLLKPRRTWGQRGP